ncbi:hypothetical protein [Paraliobacillus sediminis]|uniref:hypothetical protein n=1 Tax=Paraliobacillus sediminis TaxID=1885916 RepID=UPI000E3BD03F|nr:hypothetical protein [Paraliobacillus sediminis]
MKNTNMSQLIELDCNTGCTLNSLTEMEGALMLLDDLVADMKDHPEAAASYVAEGIITKKLSAINLALKTCLYDSQKEINSAHKIVQQLVDNDRRAEDESN